jgi:hypothetical protein
MMNAQLKHCPRLWTCVVEDRFLPVVPTLGLGTIVLTPKVDPTAAQRKTIQLRGDSQQGRRR